VLFNSFSYLLFLPVVFLVYWAIPAKWRIGFLLAASYFFYMSWKPVYGLLIFALTAINYCFGLLIAAALATSVDNSLTVQVDSRVARAGLAIKSKLLEESLASSSVATAAIESGSTARADSAVKVKVNVNTEISPITSPTISPGAASAKLAKVWLIIGLVANLACLCFFKYTNFFVDSFNSSIGYLKANVASQALFAEAQPGNHFEILLPLGISFFTFEFIHYIVDVYRGHKPITRPLDFFLFASFFPSQIAGPIKRFQDFRGQLESLPVFKKSYLESGLSLILQGAFKKVALGDNLALIANQGFDHYQSLSVGETWLAALAFAFQLFFDFSGYTDIGRGSALILGFKVPENFNIPYLAGSPTEFWNRWHLSLSTWLRDYLYIPLGGSRGGRVAVWRNLVITMGLSGLWHGAAWHFVAWGLAHAAVLVLSKEWQKLLDKMAFLASFRTTYYWHFLAVAVTFVLMCGITVFFRAQSVGQACAMIIRLSGWGAPLLPADLSGSAIFTEFALSTLPFSMLAYGLYCLICCGIGRAAESSSVNFSVSVNKSVTRAGFIGMFDGLALNLGWLWQRNLGLRVSFCVAVATIVVAFAPGKLTPFIYFQF
jgi:D-alanyl-lipoteichoic acid acyltransferase DltB (MBOAT superfamily)